MLNSCRYIILICPLLLMSSCNKMVPAGFWIKFHSDLLIKNISDQGPYGGTRAMYWKAQKQNTFTSFDILDFASKHNWKLVRSSQVTADSIKNWKLYDQDIFPLSHKGIDLSEKNNDEHKKFPRWINSSITLYEFKTNWVLIEPGSDSSTELNGFVLINDIGTEMSVYHSWGE